MDKTIKESIKELAKKMRIKIIKMLYTAGSGHPGGSLSCVEILAYLFSQKIKRTRENAFDEDRHRFVLSKGHGVPAVYALFSEIGILKEEELYQLRKVGSPLQGHPDRVKFPYIEVSTGSLGQGLSVAIGMAMGAKLKNADYTIYCLCSDGELQQGQMWEALMAGPKFNLDNLIVFLDYNKIQLDGWVDRIMPVEPVKDKIASFNWELYEIDGHDLEQIDKVFSKMKRNNGKPKFIICHTIKGKGISFMENDVEWHGVAPKKEDAQKALEELEES
ncbi:MAG: transketolase [Spirochaetes bacterium]|nr:transketolase [Spirochaetota bacterium]